MLFLVFTLPCEPITERFDDTSVRDDLSDNDALRIDHEHLMQRGNDRHAWLSGSRSRAGSGVSEPT